MAATTETSIVTKLFSAIEVLQKGKALQNPETWKNNSALMSIILGALALIPQFFPNIPLDTSAQNAIAFGLVSAIGVFNGYVHIASSDKVGLPPKS